MGKLQPNVDHALVYFIILMPTKNERSNTAHVRSQKHLFEKCSLKIFVGLKILEKKLLYVTHLQSGHHHADYHQGRSYRGVFWVFKHPAKVIREKMYPFKS